MTRIALAMAFFACLIAPSSCWAFPRPWLSLVHCWEESTQVVFAEVVDVTDLYDGWDGHKTFAGQHVVLSVCNVLKGRAIMRQETMKVFNPWSGWWDCSFPKGKNVLAFLSFDQEHQMYVPALSPEGSIELKEAGFHQYATVLEKLPSILAEKDEAARRRRLVDWNVECAVHPVTRGQGSIGLAYVRGKDRNTPNDPLTDAHKAKLVKAITSESPPSIHTASLVSTLQSYPSPELDRYLLESLRRSHQRGWEDLSRTAMEKLPGRLGIELKESTQQRRKEWAELINLTNNISAKKEPDRYKKEKERYHTVWGSLSFDVYLQCRDAIEKRK